NWLLSTSSPFRPCCFRSSSSSLLSNMIVGELSISTSHLIPEQNGPHNKSLRRSRSTAHRNICYEIAIRSTDRNSANRSKSWTSKKSSARQGHHGKEPMLSVSSARSAENVWTT